MTAVEAKKLEIEAIEASKKQTTTENRWYFDGKAAAYSHVWQLIAFKGLVPSPEEYNELNREHSKLVNLGDLG